MSEQVPLPYPIYNPGQFVDDATKDIHCVTWSNEFPDGIWRITGEQSLREGYAFELGALGLGQRITTLLSGRAAAIAESGSPVQATIHEAELLAGREFSPHEVALTRTGRVLTEAGGAKVCIKAVGDRFNVIVEGERGVITGLKNISQKSLERLAVIYGWK